MMRLVLPDATPRDDLDDIAAELGLLLINIVPRADTHPAQVIYVTPDRQAAVHLVDEGGAGSLCWVVRGEGASAEEVEARWAEALRGARAGEAS